MESSVKIFQKPPRWRGKRPRLGPLVTPGAGSQGSIEAPGAQGTRRTDGGQRGRSWEPRVAVLLLLGGPFPWGGRLASLGYCRCLALLQGQPDVQSLKDLQAQSPR